jgi:hypothetical protein
VSAGSSALPILLLVAGVSMSAQQRRLQVVPDHSTVRVFLGTAENPTSFDVGVAKVRGEKRLVSDDIGASRFNFTIYSAGVRDQQVYGERSVITFQSETIEQRKDGKLEVHGQLTATQVFGKGGANEDDSDASSGNARPLRTSEEVTFVFDGLEQPASASDLSSRDVVPVQENGSEPGMLVTASMSVNGETFPQLLLTIQDVAWPLIADNESCATRSPGEDYGEVTCAEATSPASSVQPGDEQAPPAGNLVTIQLKLALTSADTDSAGGLPHTAPVR